MRYLCVVAVALCVVGLCVGSALSNGQNDRGEGIQITVAPNTIVLNSLVDSVTVHSNLPLDSVVPGSVTLNGVTVVNIWADTRGHLVARMALAVLVEDVEPPEVTITLAGELIDDGPFAASDTVRVIRGRE